MATIANLLIKLGVDTGEADAKLQGFGGKAAGALRKGFVPALAVLGGVGVMANKVAKDASTLSEAQNAVNVVFGEGAQKLHNFSSKAAKQAGLSMTEFYQLVTPVGAMLKNTGFSADQAATASLNLSKRAADMASVFDTEVSDALEAIQAGLRGEADPLERFGVGLNEAAVNAKAMQMGLAKSKTEVSANAKMQARLALIMEQTSDIQGDFARTSGEAENQGRINRAEMANLSATLGQSLLPALKMWRSLVGELIGFMARHQTAAKVLVGVVTGLAAAIVVANVALRVAATVSAVASAAKAAYAAVTKVATASTVTQTGAQISLNAAMRANPIGAVITVLVLLAGGLVTAYKTSERFRNVVNAVFSAVVSAARTVWSAFGQVLGKAQEIAGWGGWRIILSVIGGPFVAIALNVGRVRDAVNAVLGAAKAVYNWGGWSVIGKVIAAPFQVADRAVDLAVNAVRAVVGAGQAVVGWGGWGTIGGVIAAPFRAAIGAIQSVLGAINNVIGAAQRAINIVGKIKKPFSGGSDPSKSVIIPGTATRWGKSIPAGATGGIVTRPTLALIGEAGPEAVVPLNRTPGSSPLPDGLGGGGPSVHIHGDMVVQDATDVELMVSRLGRMLAVGVA